MARLCASASGGPLWIRTRKCTAGTDLGLLAPAPLLSSGSRHVRTVLPDLGTGGYRAVRCYRLAIRAYQRKPAAHDVDALGREPDDRHRSRCRTERNESFCAERFAPIFADSRALVGHCSLFPRSHAQGGTGETMATGVIRQSNNRFENLFFSGMAVLIQIGRAS